MLVLCSNWNIIGNIIVFVNCIYDMVGCWYSVPQVVYGRPFARVLFVFLMKYIDTTTRMTSEKEHWSRFPCSHAAACVSSTNKKQFLLVGEVQNCESAIRYAIRQLSVMHVHCSTTLLHPLRCLWSWRKRARVCRLPCLTLAHSPSSGPWSKCRDWTAQDISFYSSVIASRLWRGMK